MKIIHIAPNATYNENWSYQENLLPRYQKKLGNEVLLCVSTLEHHGGKKREVPCCDCITKDGFRVIRRPQRRVRFPLLGRFVKKINIYDVLVEEKPDLIFYHGLVSATIFQVCKYKRKMAPHCVIVQDNHQDFNIGYMPNTLKGFVLSCVFSVIFSLTRKYISKVYGVTPWRAEYAQKFFGVPADMTDVLIMGADDEKIDFAHREEIRTSIRNQYGIADNDFLIVTGAKIDARKKIHLLMEAVNQMEGIKLLVFGNVLDDIKEEFEKQLSDKVQWVGFIPSDDAYNYFFAADLVVFPGQHSVLWEQACACKVPCAFAHWDGMEHVNNGGNACFIDDISVDGIKRCIESLKRTPAYEKMKECAESEKTDIYLYSNIARKSLEMLYCLL